MGPMKEKFQNHKTRAGFGWLIAVAVMWSVLAPAPCVLAAPASPASLPLDQYINRVQASYHEVRSIRADFTQTYDSGGGSRVESGTVVFARGGRMRWDYQEPEKKVFISNKREVLLYLPSANQLNRSPVKQSEDYRIPFRLLLSRLDLRKVFGKFEDANSQFPHPAEDRVVIAYPKHAEKLGYKHVVMEFDPEMNIRRLVIAYADNSVMKFRFSHIDRNPKLADSLFEFTAPPGTQVIHHE